MKKIFLLLILITITKDLFAQGVGINTTSPDPSAALDIQSSNKGILIPKVELQSLTDKETIPNPANSLMIYNTNFSLKYGTGFYYNANTSASPDWTPVSRLTVPSYSAGNDPQTLFRVDNYNANNQNATAIKGYSASTGTGVYAESSAGNALVANGKVRIFGNGQNPGTGKVLTSNSTGEATWEGGIAFSFSGLADNAGKVTNQNIYKIPFLHQQFDLQNNYSVQDRCFTAPVKGIYHFDAQTTCGSNIIDPYYANLWLLVTSGGSSKKVSDRFVSVTNITYLSLSKDVLLEEGDKVSVHFLFQNSTTEEPELIGSGISETYFTGHLVLKQ